MPWALEIQRVAFSMGLIQLGYFIMYMVCGMHFLKTGNLISGGIYVVFASAFGLFGGLGNLSAALCPIWGIQYDPMLTSVCFVFAGLYLLFILPALRFASMLDFLGILGAGIVCLPLDLQASAFCQLY
jgi:hypothetical protein